MSSNLANSKVSAVRVGRKVTANLARQENKKLLTWERAEAGRGRDPGSGGGSVRGEGIPAHH